jgi:hypothetical protein
MQRTRGRIYIVAMYAMMNAHVDFHFSVCGLWLDAFAIHAVKRD